jgi:hypothetical protein
MKFPEQGHPVLRRRKIASTPLESGSPAADKQPLLKPDDDRLEKPKPANKRLTAPSHPGPSPAPSRQLKQPGHLLATSPQQQQQSLVAKHTQAAQQSLSASVPHQEQAASGHATSANLQRVAHPLLNKSRSWPGDERILVEALRKIAPMARSQLVSAALLVPLTAANKTDLKALIELLSELPGGHPVEFAQQLAQLPPSLHEASLMLTTASALSQLDTSARRPMLSVLHTVYADAERLTPATLAQELQVLGKADNADLSRAVATAQAIFGLWRPSASPHEGAWDPSIWHQHKFALVKLALPLSDPDRQIMQQCAKSLSSTSMSFYSKVEHLKLTQY